MGPPSAAVPDAERLVALAPGDEHRWVLLMRALDRSGRRGDALGAFERARRSLARRLGLDPGAELRAAHEEVLHAGERPRHEGPDRPIGRDALVASVSDLVVGTSIVVVTGEAGIGRSCVLAQVARGLRRVGATVATCRCVEHPATAVAVLEDLVADLGEELPPGVPPVAGFVEVVRRRSESAPRLVLVVDDLHRAGPTTVAALRAASDIDAVAVVGSTADGQPAPPAWRRRHGSRSRRWTPRRPGSSPALEILGASPTGPRFAPGCTA